MQRNTIWTLAAATTVAGALATLPATPVTAGGVAIGSASYRCYPASALKGATGDLPVHLTGLDEAGPFNVTLTKAKSLCLGAHIDNATNNNTAVVVPPVVCFATKDLERPSSFPTGIVINVTVEHVGDLRLKLKKSKLTCLPLAVGPQP